MNRRQAASATHRQVSSHNLAINTKKSYEGSINTLKRHMTAEELAEYIRPDGKLLKPLNAEITGRIIHDALKQVDENGVETMKSTSSCSGYRSALKYWHDSSNTGEVEETIEVLPGAKLALANYAKGLVRIEANDRADGEEVHGTGKIPMSFKCYSTIARRAIAETRSSKEALLVHPYLLLSWNLMARSSNVVDLLWNNIK